ncbi:M48 family metalloprotease, partial [Rugamonas sp.]|uniref:M48 family metalloprotease n=1 Tax=Rugamonas sp. TaxID=1926287 RepID=UPI0025CD72E0
ALGATSAPAAPKKTPPPAASVASASAEAAPAVAPAAEASAPAVPDAPPPADSPGLFGRVKSFFGGDGQASKVKDIDEVFSTSAREFDPTCKSMVEPFGVTDNAMSLLKLSARIGLNNAAVKIGAGGQAMDMRGMLKLAGKNLNWLPTDAERMLGEKVHGDMADELLDGDRKPNRVLIARAQLLLQTLALQIKEETPYQFQIDVRKGAGNAMALPGGYIVIDRDLVADAKNEDKAYFALAHELAHVLQRHETRANQARLTDAIDSVDGLRKLMEASNRTPASLMAYSNDIMTRFVVFSRAQEMQADACAVRLLDAAFPDKKRLHHIIQSYQASMGPPVADGAAGGQLDLFVGNLGKMDKLGEQHPNSLERRANLDKMLVEVSVPAKAAVSVKAAPVVTVH